MNGASIIKDSVRVIPKNISPTSNMMLYMVQTHDIIEPWNGNQVKRDEDLSKFWKEEPFLESAITSLAMTRAALSWELSGPPRTVKNTQIMLNSADFGQGWQHLMMLVNTDLLTSDNGAFIEIIREKATRGRKPESMPVLGLAHLPAIRCFRTGNPMQPVIYIDRDNKEHKLNWYQVITLAENPIPESETGRQLCFVSRVLGFAQMIKDVEQHHREKLSGRFSKAIHVVSGVAQGEIETIKQVGEIDNNNRGMYRYGQPVILTTIDPNARVTKETIELASLPDGFDFDQLMNWYITLLALASGSDYQEFAPLSNGNLGTASQSDTLHRKAQRKGTQLFIKQIETALHQAKVIPATVTFRFKQQDAAAELEQADIEKTRADTRSIQITSGEITPAVARQIAVDKGDLRQQYLLLLGEQDATPNVTVSDDEDVADELLNPPAANTNVPPTTNQPSNDTTSPPDTDKAYTIKTGNDVDPRTATHIALWWLKAITDHPLQAASPIPDTQLWEFTTALRNNLKTGITGTTEGWMSSDLVNAAYLAGINPIVLRMRLPDEHKTYVDTNRAFSKDKLISDVTPYVLKSVNPLAMIIADFKASYPTSLEKNALTRDTTIAVYKLARGAHITETDFDALKAIVNAQVQIVNRTDSLNMLVLGLYKTYNTFS